MFYSQRDIRWAREKLGGSTSTTLGASGCFITSICNLLAYHDNVQGLDPSRLNKMLLSKGCFAKGGLLVAPLAAKMLGYSYRRVTDLRGVKAPNFVVAETDHYKKYGVPQHFFLYNRAAKRRIDPLDAKPEWEDNNYNIVSYRIFEEIKSNGTEPMQAKELVIDKQTENADGTVSIEGRVKFGEEDGNMELKVTRSVFQRILDLFK